MNGRQYNKAKAEANGKRHLLLDAVVAISFYSNIPLLSIAVVAAAPTANNNDDVPSDVDTDDDDDDIDEEEHFAAPAPARSSSRKKAVVSSHFRIHGSVLLQVSSCLGGDDEMRIMYFGNSTASRRAPTGSRT